MFFAPHRVTSRIKKRCSPCTSVALRGKKVFFAPLRVTSRIKKRCSPCTSVALRGKKVFFAPLRVTSRIKKGVLRVPPWPSVDKKGVLRAPSRNFADQEKVFSVYLRGPPWTKKVFFAPLRVTSRIKKRCSPCTSVALRGQKVFFAPLRVTSRIKKRCSPCTSVALRGSKGVRCSPSPQPNTATKIKAHHPNPRIPVFVISPRQTYHNHSANNLFTATTIGATTK